MKKCEAVGHIRRLWGSKDCCVTCHMLQGRKYRQLPGVLEKKRIYTKQYQSRPEVKCRMAMNSRKRKYGVAVLPQGLCQICNTKPADSLDHNHETNAIRGWLCRFCNVRLGWFENKEWTAKAVEYLKQ